MTVEDRVRQQFEGATREHQLTVIREDGLYRHLRCQKPGTWMYGFDVVTWPGYLAIVGDIGDYLFSRVRDMLEFFESGNGRINPHYWSEKLQAPRPDGAMRYSEDRLRAHLREWLSDIADGYDGPGLALDEQGPAGGRVVFELARAVDEQILRHDDIHFEAGARILVRDFDHDEYQIVDAWEWDLRDFDHQFLFCCHAIVWAIARYRLQSGAATHGH